MLTLKQAKKLNYVQLMAFLGEVNRPPGGKNSVRQVVQNCFINKDSAVLDVGCNTGYCSFEVAHLVKCRVVGIDIDPDMIKTANKFKKLDPLGHLVRFMRGDARHLPFKKNTFDVVMSGGSTAFVTDKFLAIKEYKRVLKNLGMIADINFFYRKKPPQILIKKINKLLGIDIKIWGEDYWRNIYKQSDLEEYFVFTDQAKFVSKKEIKDYCRQLLSEKKFSKDVEKELLNRLVYTMSLFNENLKYLSYGVFVYRKHQRAEQVSLFGE